MSEHFWIIEVNGDPAKWGWVAAQTGRGGLDVIAYRSRKDAASALYEQRRLYGHARLTKYTPADPSNSEREK